MEIPLGPGLAFRLAGHIHRLLTLAGTPDEENVGFVWKNNVLPTLVALKDISPNEILYM
jgi:hypothetical protein